MVTWNLRIQPRAARGSLRRLAKTTVGVATMRFSRLRHTPLFRNTAARQSLPRRRGGHIPPLLPKKCSTSLSSRFFQEYRRTEGSEPIKIDHERSSSESLLDPKRDREPLTAFEWFVPSQGDITSDYEPGRRLQSFPSVILPYELIVYRQEIPTLMNFHRWLLESEDTLRRTAAIALGGAIAEVSRSSRLDEGEYARLCQLDAPLALFLAASDYNRRPRASDYITSLYIAQASITDLPSALQDDLPMPSVLMGSEEDLPVDIYGTSIWLGLEPTFTPWHRDPNPNFFQQLCGQKIVRLMDPKRGEELFRQTQARFGQPGSNPRIRSASMFEGPERAAWYDAIWAPDAKYQPDLREAHLWPNDCLFIPQGWWHSVRSVESRSPNRSHLGCLNASVNWWFRHPTMNHVSQARKFDT